MRCRPGQQGLLGLLERKVLVVVVVIVMKIIIVILGLRHRWSQRLLLSRLLWKYIGGRLLEIVVNLAVTEQKGIVEEAASTAWNLGLRDRYRLGER